MKTGLEVMHCSLTSLETHATRSRKITIALWDIHLRVSSYEQSIYAQFCLIPSVQILSSRYFSTASVFWALHNRRVTLTLVGDIERVFECQKRLTKLFIPPTWIIGVQSSKGPEAFHIHFRALLVSYARLCLVRSIGNMITSATEPFRALQARRRVPSAYLMIWIA